MLDQELICKYCDIVLLELCKYFDSYSKRHVCYSTGKYRGHNDRDVFEQLNIPEEYVKAVVTVLDDYKFIALTARQYRNFDDDIISECQWLGINDDGRNFVKTQSFHKDWKIRADENEKSDATHRKTLQDLKIGDWLLKTKWWPHTIAIFSLIAAISSSIYAGLAYRLSEKIQEQTATKEELKKQLQETKNEIYTHVDSVYRTTHIEDSTKKK